MVTTAMRRPDRRSGTPSHRWRPDRPPDALLAAASRPRYNPAPQPAGHREWPPASGPRARLRAPHRAASERRGVDQVSCPAITQYTQKYTAACRAEVAAARTRNTVIRKVLASWANLEG